jgi:ATP synthase protein I
MTTESKQDTRRGVVPLLGALLAGAVAVGVLAVTAAVTGSSSDVAGALVGGLVTLAVFAVGVGLVSLVARVMPSASLLVALMTYTLQLLALALVVVALERSGTAGDEISRGWFAAGVIAVTVLWLAGQVLAAVRQRIPAYGAALPGEAPGGER